MFPLSVASPAMTSPSIEQQEESEIIQRVLDRMNEKVAARKAVLTFGYLVPITY